MIPARAVAEDPPRPPGMSHLLASSVRQYDLPPQDPLRRATKLPDLTP
ncbi:hypothetical protein [Lentzea cavernae]|nr:hypothetical protein [Lentzea cavernae]